MFVAGTRFVPTETCKLALTETCITRRCNEQALLGQRGCCGHVTGGGCDAPKPVSHPKTLSTCLDRGDPAGDPRILLFDAFHDVFRGVVCLVEVVDGTLRAGDRVTAASSGETYDVSEARASRAQTLGSAGLGEGHKLWQRSSSAWQKLSKHPM